MISYIVRRYYPLLQVNWGKEFTLRLWTRGEGNQTSVEWVWTEGVVDRRTVSRGMDRTLRTTILLRPSINLVVPPSWQRSLGDNLTVVDSTPFTLSSSQPPSYVTTPTLLWGKRKKVTVFTRKVYWTRGVEPSRRRLQFLLSDLPFSLLLSSNSLPVTSLVVFLCMVYLLPNGPDRTEDTFGLSQIFKGSNSYRSHISQKIKFLYCNWKLVIHSS